MTVFGIDFGTTNSLAARVFNGKVVPLVDTISRKPHPSVIWYRGEEVVRGQAAKSYLDLTGGGAPPGFVRSPKSSLRTGSRIYPDGRPIEPAEAAAEVLKHLVEDAMKSREITPTPLTRAVMTIPVNFGGRERRTLREAARAAGISVTQFVHEPAAALYGHLRSLPDFQGELARLEGRSVLVFDWGGGTLDLTLCRIERGTILQVANEGDNTIGGDEFDLKLRNLIRERHARQYQLSDLPAFEQPGMGAQLLNQCERVKIELSEEGNEDETIFVKNYLRIDGPAQNALVPVTRQDLDGLTGDLVAKGLALIDSVLARARLGYQDIEVCLATGGMVNMPAIASALFERFPGRLVETGRGDRIIAEGAAWIAHDQLRLTLAKPIEMLIADSSGRGTYHKLVDAGLRLPLENETQPASNTRLFCVDPREGTAVVEIAKPVGIGPARVGDARETLCVAKVAVDPNAEPLIERIECHLSIDHDYVVQVRLASTGRGSQTVEEFHDLEFGLAMPTGRSGDDGSGPRGGGADGQDGTGQRRMSDAASASSRATACATSNLTQRTNVAIDRSWRLVPGDIVVKWRINHFDQEQAAYSRRQERERMFYRPCGLCKRPPSMIAQGPVDLCRRQFCGMELPAA